MVPASPFYDLRYRLAVGALAAVVALEYPGAAVRIGYIRVACPFCGGTAAPRFAKPGAYDRSLRSGLRRDNQMPPTPRNRATTTGMMNHVSA